MTEPSSVLIEKRGPAHWITNNRPEKRNAVNANEITGLARGKSAAPAPRPKRQTKITTVIARCSATK